MPDDQPQQTPQQPSLEQIDGHVTHATAASPEESHSIWQRMKDAFTMPDSAYQQKYVADDQALQNKVTGALHYVIPFMSDADVVQHQADNTRLGRQVGEFVQSQLQHPEQFVQTGGIEGAEPAAIEEGVRSELEKIPGLLHHEMSVEPSGPEWERTHRIMLDGQHVGTVAYDKTPEGTARIIGSHVKPEYRGQGLGKAAYKSVIEEAKQNPNVRRITSDPVNLSPDAARVWESLKKDYPVEDIVHPNGKPGYQIDLAPQMEPVLATQAQPWHEKAADLRTKNDGFTIDPRTGEEPVEGDRNRSHIIEAVPEARETLDHDVTAEDIRKFAEKNKALLDEHPELVVGGYKNELNLSAPGTETGARLVGPRLDQEAAWDVNQKQVLPLSGQNKRTQFPEYPIKQRLADLKIGSIPEREEGTASQDVLQKMTDRYGVTEDASGLRRGASFITPDGKFIHLPSGVTHDAAIDFSDETKQYAGSEDNRVKFLNDSGAVRVRFNPTDKAGPTTHISVPASGVVDEQIPAIRQAIAQAGRNGNVVMERADVTPETKDRLTMRQEFPRAADTEEYLRRIEAHPETAYLPAQHLTPPEWMKYTESSHVPMEQILFHEGGHAVVADAQGLPPIEVRSHLHPAVKSGKGLIATTHVDMSNIPGMYFDTKSKNFRISPAAVTVDMVNQYAPVLMAGGVAEQLGYGLDLEKNPSMYGDKGLLERLGQAAGLSPAEFQVIRQKAIDRAKEILTQGDTLDKMKQHFAQRAPGLDPRLHMDLTGMQNMLRDIKGAEPDVPRAGITKLRKQRAAINPAIDAAAAARGKRGGIGGGAGEGGRTDVAGAEGTTPSPVGRTIESELQAAVKPPPAGAEEGEQRGWQRKAPKGSTVHLYGAPLPTRKTGEGGMPTVVDVAQALNKFSAQQNPKLVLGKSATPEMVERAKSIMEDESRYQLAQANSGENWYKEDIAEHDRILQDMRPELKDPTKLSLFKAAEAILSSGQKPYGNFRGAVRAWDNYNKTGAFARVNPETGKSWGPRHTAAYGNAFGMLNTLIAQKGEAGASEWLLGKHPISELRQYNPDVKGKMTNEVPGAYILGAKRGPFSLNLHGREAEFTADMWVSRTWNRWMGTMEFGKNPEGDMEIRSDSPRNQTERGLMKQSFEEAAQRLGKSTSQLQAIMWYYEQGLYRAHGLDTESWSFSQAARRAADEEKAAQQYSLFGPEPSESGRVSIADLFQALDKPKK